MKKKKYIIILIIIIICILLYFNKFSIYKDLYEDILLLTETANNKKNIYDKSKEQNSNENVKYIFNIKCKDTKLKAVNLSDTIKKETMVNEKIAPGLKGEFSIVLNANQDTKYNVIFNSINIKPKNLRFVNEETKTVVKNLEEFEKLLTGNLKKDETKTITISWYWQYENTQERNRQDTIDSKNIQNYQFKILAFGESIV